MQWGGGCWGIDRCIRGEEGEEEKGGGESGEQQLVHSRGPGEGAGEEVSIALLLQRLPDTGSGMEVKRKTGVGGGTEVGDTEELTV